MRTRSTAQHDPVDWRGSPRYDSIIPAAVMVVRGPDGAPTFVRQKSGPFAGRWMLPGGGIERGEFARDAAVRETREECGIVVPPHDIRPIGAYEVISESTDDPPHHVLLFAFVAEGRYRLPAGFVGDNSGGTTQAHPDRFEAHSTDRVILADANLLAVRPEALAAALVDDQLKISALR